MIYMVVYTRLDCNLKDFYGKSEKIQKAAGGLQLEQISAGEETVIWKKADGFHALISCRTINNLSIQARDFPLVIGLLMDEADAEQLMHSPETFIGVVHALQSMSYEDTSKLIRTERIEFQNWQELNRQIGFRQKYRPTHRSAGPTKVSDRVYLNACILAGLVEDKTLYVKNTISLEELVTLISGLPGNMKREINFSIPFGGTPAGECMLNILSGKGVLDLTKDGYRANAERITVAGLDSFERKLETAAKELLFAGNNSEYRDYLDQYSITEIKEELEFMSFCRAVNELGMAGGSLEKHRDIIWDNRQRINKIIPFIEYEGLSEKLQYYLEHKPTGRIDTGKTKRQTKKREKTYTKVTDKIAAPDNHPHAPHSGWKTAKSEKQSGKAGCRYRFRFQMSPFYLLTFLAAAALSGLILTDYYNFGSVKTLYIFLVAEPKSLALTALLQVMVLVAFNLLNNLRFRRNKDNDVYDFEYPAGSDSDQYSNNYDEDYD